MLEKSPRLFKLFKFEWLLVDTGWEGRNEAIELWLKLFGRNDVVWSKWHELTTSKWGFESSNRDGPADAELRAKLEAVTTSYYLSGPSSGSTNASSLLVGNALRGGEKVGEIDPCGWWTEGWVKTIEEARHARA